MNLNGKNGISSCGSVESPSFLPMITDNLMKRIRPIQDVKIIVKQTGSNTLNIIEELGKKTIIDNGEKSTTRK